MSEERESKGKSEMEYHLRAHYDAAYLAALTGLSSKEGYDKWDYLCEDAKNLAIASLRNRAAALAERDSVIKEVLNAV